MTLTVMKFECLIFLIFFLVKNKNYGTVIFLKIFEEFHDLMSLVDPKSCRYLKKDLVN